MRPRELTEEQIKTAYGRRTLYGLSMRRLANELGVTPEALTYRFKKANLKIGFKRVCELIDCKKTFFTYQFKQRYCSKTHSKLASSRTVGGRVAEYAVCKLPECPKEVFRVGVNGHYCTKNHQEKDRLRKKSSFYKRILGVGPACQVCDETLIVDEHHIEFKGSKSNKESMTIWLCPTHHMCIHRGLAEIVDMKFRFKTNDILYGLGKKQPEYVKQTLGDK